MATRFDVRNMIANTASAFHSGENWIWVFFARAGYLLRQADETGKADFQKAKGLLERELMKAGRHSPTTISNYVSKAVAVSRFWRWELPEADNDGKALSFVEALEFNELDKADLDGMSEGSIIQKVRNLWQAVNEISEKKGPISERDTTTTTTTRKKGGKAEKAEGEKAEGEKAEGEKVTPIITTLAQAVAAVAMMQPTVDGLAQALEPHPELIKAIRSALVELDTIKAEEAAEKQAA